VIVHDLHKDIKDVIKIYAIVPTFPHSTDVQHQSFKHFNL